MKNLKEYILESRLYIDSVKYDASNKEIKELVEAIPNKDTKEKIKNGKLDLLKLGNIIFTTTNGSYWVGKFNIVICKKDNEGDLINLLRDYHHDNGQDFKGGNHNKTEKVSGEYLAFDVEGKEW